VQQTERVSVGQNQTITVGVNRTAQVGNNDTTTVGVQHLVMIAPPGEGDPGSTHSASITMTDKKIVLDTGAGATITMDRDKISIVADDLVEIRGKKRGVNLHAPAPGGKANVFTGDSFTVDCTHVSIKASADMKLLGADIDINGKVTEIEGAVIEIDASTSVDITAKGHTTVDGGNVDVTSAGTILVKGSVVDVQGDPIKLNS
jgi:type VI secretion system secreted protein VgrG